MLTGRGVIRNEDSKKTNELGLLWLFLVIGIIAVFISGTVIVHFKEIKMHAVMAECFYTVKSRMMRLNSNESADRTKSEIRLLDKAKELSRCINDKEVVLENFVPLYAQEQRIAAILITDENGKTTYKWGNVADDLWKNLMNSGDAKKIMEYPERSYMSQITRQKKIYDFTVVSRQDSVGCVALISEKKDIMAPDEISMGSLLDDLIFEMDGTVAIVTNDRIISSNDATLKGVGITEWFGNDVDKLFSERDITDLERSGRHYCVGRKNVDEYQVYLLFPKSNVYLPMIAVESFAGILYILACTVFLFLRYQQVQDDIRKDQEYLRTISSIGTIYSFVVSINLMSDTWKMLKSTVKLEKEYMESVSAKQMLSGYEKKIIDEGFVKKYHKFSQMDQLSERLKGQKYLSCDVLDREGRWNQLSFAPQSYDGAGNLTEVLFLSRDITMEKKREIRYQDSLKKSIDTAERASVAKTDFLRRMSHDIRTPINGIKGMIAISRHYAGDEEKQEECRRKMQDATDFLLDLVNNVLDMNKLESGEIQLEERSFDLKELFYRTVSLVEAQAVEHRIHFQVEECEGSHWNVTGSPLHIQQIFQNIMSNAVKYNREKGSVTVAVKEISWDGEEAGFEFTCQDTGIGMTEEFQKYAFEPFAQEESTARTFYVGTGLGLPIAKELTEKMGGTITFSSQRGQGTAFCVSLRFPVDMRKKEEVNNEESLRIDGVRILLTEDNALNMEIAEFLLLDAGAYVEKAWNGKEAVERFRASEEGYYDLILMDIMMPEMDGLEAARQIRNTKRKDAASVPIFAMTANAFRDDKDRSRMAGMNAHISKPINAQELICIINRYLKNHPRQETT